jgi:HK97 family phage major capsid protein
MYARVLNPSQAIWFINQDAFPQLMTMTLGNQPIWTPPQSGLQNAPGGLLFGRPVRFSEHCATVGDQGDIQLVSPKGYYAVSKRNAPQFASSIHLYFDYNIQAFRWTFRLGGQPHLSAAVSPAKGATTRSHFVTLDARA